MTNFVIIENIFHKKKNGKIKVGDMSHFDKNIYQKDLEDIMKHKTVNEMLNTFHENLFEIIN